MKSNGITTTESPLVILQWAVSKDDSACSNTMRVRLFAIPNGLGLTELINFTERSGVVSFVCLNGELRSPIKTSKYGCQVRNASAN